MALEIMSQTKIDLLLLDVELQNTTGYDFLVKHRKYIFDDLAVCVMLITGMICPTLLRDSNRLGVVEILKKPYIIEELILKIEYHLLNKEKEKALDSSNQLLGQYKQTVDNSSIVSKTNAKGIITYVNEAFCKISGYTQEELIGRPHNIVRHPDVDSLVFQDLWKTIKEYKRAWQGKIKNQKKDGSSYWVQTIVNPILDSNGDIIEYIAIRNDITELESTKEYFKQQFHITQENYKEVITLSKMYEKAMEESNIILRADLKRRITYANQRFYEISGYTQEELIGQHYDFIKRQDDVSLNEVNEMWNTLEKGEIWKGQVRNVSKDGKAYYSLATVVPIKNYKGEILEYMSIRKDISDVILLHKELEDTQREIIYKLGEVGESRSKETGNHVKRVAQYSKLMAELCGLSKEGANILFTASPMHDIGKVGIPDSILNKPGKLTDEEFEEMKAHASIGYNILKNSNRKVLQAAAIVANEHHEKWDGTGYPRRLKGNEIHIYGRITAVVDVFDALSHDRVYKPAWDLHSITELFKKERGKHFDPQLVDLFFEHFEKFEEIRDQYND
jgi:PAS domain S-box-containing protein